MIRREHSQKELLNKLQIKGFNKDEILPVIEELAQQGWQDDARYAECYARQRIQRGYGPVAVMYELARKGVEIDNLEDMLQSLAGNWMAVLEKVYRKKYPHEKHLSRNEWAKRSRFLVQRGFPATMISALFDQLPIKFS